MSFLRDVWFWFWLMTLLAFVADIAYGVRLAAQKQRRLDELERENRGQRIELHNARREAKRR